MVLKRITSSSIGRKTIVAVTGSLLLLFLVVHMLGNWTVFLGPDAMNSYAEKLHNLGALLWIARLVLVVAFVLHVYFTIQLNIDNRNARPVPYRKKEYIKATLSSRTMVLSGLVILAFLIYHLLHYTLGIITPETFKANLTDSQGRPDVYQMVIYGFKDPLISLTYIIAVFLLAMHLDHALQSAIQTLGFTNKRIFPGLIRFSRLFAVFIFLGYSIIPASILFGIIP